MDLKILLRCVHWLTGVSHRNYDQIALYLLCIFVRFVCKQVNAGQAFEIILLKAAVFVRSPLASQSPVLHTSSFWTFYCLLLSRERRKWRKFSFNVTSYKINLKHCRCDENLLLPFFGFKFSNVPNRYLLYFYYILNVDCLPTFFQMFIQSIFQSIFQSI